MTPEVRLSRGDRRHSIFNSFPTPRVRVHVSPFVTRGEHRAERKADPDEADDLSAARGILFLGLAGVAMWALIGFAYWFIAR